MGITVLFWWISMAAFALTAAAVHYLCGGSLLGVPAWVWGLMGGVGCALSSCVGFLHDIELRMMNRG